MHSPLLWMTLTLVAYQAGFWLHRRLGEPLLMPPLLWSLIILITVVVVGKVDYQTYFQANAFIHFLLGTSTVALAVPLYQSLPRMKMAMAAGTKVTTTVESGGEFTANQVIEFTTTSANTAATFGTVSLAGTRA